MAANNNQVVQRLHSPIICHISCFYATLVQHRLARAYKKLETRTEIQSGASDAWPVHIPRSTSMKRSSWNTTLNLISLEHYYALHSLNTPIQSTTTTYSGLPAESHLMLSVSFLLQRKTSPISKGLCKRLLRLGPISLLLLKSSPPFMLTLCLRLTTWPRDLYISST